MSVVLVRPLPGVSVRPAWSAQLHALLHLSADGDLIHRVDAEGRIGYAYPDGGFLPYEKYSEFGALLRPSMVFLEFFTWDVKKVKVRPAGLELLADWNRHHPGFAASLCRRRDDARARRGTEAV